MHQMQIGKEKVLRTETRKKKKNQPPKVDPHTTTAPWHCEASLCSAKIVVENCKLQETHVDLAESY